MAWKAQLQDNYSSLSEFESYSETFGLAKRLGFETAAEAWEANPLIQGSTNPNDFRLASIRGNESIQISNALPSGEWSKVRCYDSGPKANDRYTIVYVSLGNFHKSTYGCGNSACKGCNDLYYHAVGSNSTPFIPNAGVFQHCEVQLGKHLGKRIAFASLPPDVQKAVIQDLRRA
jgi:hypothetical protein